MKIDEDAKEIDLHRIILAYAHTRIQRAAELRRLSRSMEQYGQIMPVIVVAGESHQFVLIDGYLRVEAIRRCGKDTVWAQILKTKEPDAILFLLNKAEHRQWDVVEQASMISELMSRFDMSLGDVAKQMGKDKSWVKRRVDLVRSLPEEVLKAVISGHIGTWAASRIFAPLARANASHASQLITHLRKEPMSVRELSDFYERYKKSNRRVRNKMVEEPGLFLKTLKASREARNADIIRKGPEGLWLKDIYSVIPILQRLNDQIPIVFYQGQPESEQNKLLTAAHQAGALFEHLQQKIKSVCSTNKPDKP